MRLSFWDFVFCCSVLPGDLPVTSHCVVGHPTVSSTAMDQLGHVETTVGRSETLSRMINHLRENNVNPSHFFLLFFRYSAPFKAAKQTYKARSALKEKLHDRSYTLHLDEVGNSQALPV